MKFQYSPQMSFCRETSGECRKNVGCFLRPPPGMQGTGDGRFGSPVPPLPQSNLQLHYILVASMGHSWSRKISNNHSELLQKC